MPLLDDLLAHLLDARQGAFALRDPDPRARLPRLFRRELLCKFGVVVRLALLGGGLAVSRFIAPVLFVVVESSLLAFLAR